MVQTSFFIKNVYFFGVIGFPQHFSSPLPLRVTMNSAPHFSQVYLFPA